MSERMPHATDEGTGFEAERERERDRGERIRRERRHAVDLRIEGNSYTQGNKRNGGRRKKGIT